MIRIPRRVPIALFAICVIFFVVREIPSKIFVFYWLDKPAHFLVSFSLAVLFLWIAQLRYHENAVKAKRSAFWLTLTVGVVWEMRELFLLLYVPPQPMLAFPIVNIGSIDYAIDTIIDVCMNASGAVWYLYLPEIFSSGDPASF